jgi:hypothetical protein
MVGFWVKHCHIFLGFESGFRFLLAQVISDFKLFGSGSSQILSHLISGSLEFWVVLGRIGLSRILFCPDLFRVG